MTAWYRPAAASRSAFDPQPHVGASLVGGRAAVHRHQRRVLRVKRAQLIAVDVRDATAVVHQVSHRLHCRRRLAGPGLAPGWPPTMINSGAALADSPSNNSGRTRST